MGYFKNKQVEALHFQDDDKELAIELAEEEREERFQANLKSIFKELDKAEKENLIEYYICIFFIGLISFGLGMMVGAVFV